MALKNLKDKLELLDDLIKQAMLRPDGPAVGMVSSEFKKLRFMLDGLASFVEHRWEVKLFTNDSHVVIKISAEHLEEARDTAVALIDALRNVVRCELYCDGILIPEED